MSDIIEQMNQEVDREEVRMLLKQIAQLTKERDEAIRSSGAWASTAGRLTGEVFDLRKESDRLAAKCEKLCEELSGCVSDQIDPSVNVGWMRMSPKLPEYVQAVEKERDELKHKLSDALTANHALDAVAKNQTSYANELAAKCAEMRNAILKHKQFVDSVNPNPCKGDVDLHAVLKNSDQCGVGWLSPSEREKLEARLVEINSPTWPWVRGFASEMERKLSLNRHKGDRDGWAQEGPEWLLKRLKEEITELCGAMHSGTDQQVLDEAADVANFAMMIADVSGGLKPHALSDQCGVGWLSPEKKKVLVEAFSQSLKIIRSSCGDVTTDQLIQWEQILEACK